MHMCLEMQASVSFSIGGQKGALTGMSLGQRTRGTGGGARPVMAKHVTECATMPKYKQEPQKDAAHDT